MIDHDFQKECHIFLCYRSAGAEVAKNFKKALSNIKDRSFGYVWYSDQENIGNFVFDIPDLIASARYAILFFSRHFTEGFLLDGKNNYGDDSRGNAGCVTVREIVEIERRRQAGTLTVIGVHVDGYLLQPHDVTTLKQVFENEGILTNTSLAAYTELNVNAYYSRTTDVDTFAEALSRGLEKNRRPVLAKSPRVSLDTLLPPLGYHYYGRDAELAYVEEAVKAKTCINLTGARGSGKSAFAFHWLSRIAARSYSGAEYVLYWSFDQDNRNCAISPNLSSFFEHTLSFFGIDNITDLSSELEKATALATFLQEHSVILVLDGIDTFQSRSPGQEGLLQNLSIKKIVTSVARSADDNQSLLILLSTSPVADLLYFSDRAEILPLPALSTTDGVRILRDLGVSGHERDLTSAVCELNNDPLTITLLGKILASQYNGNIKERYRVHYDAEQGEHTERILSFYEGLCPPDTPEGVFLLLCCLFRGGADGEALGHLLSATRDIPALEPARQKDLRSISRAFQDVGLLYGKYDLNLLPIVKERFRRRFREQMPEIYRRCHLILGDYHAALCNDDSVTTIAEMLPLYNAVFYYNQANEPTIALSVLWNRIFRKRTFFSQKQLGATTNDLFAISLFFDVESQWTPNPALSLVDAAWLSSVAAYLQNNIGNLVESETLRRRELAIYETLSHHLFLASDGQNLARNLMLQGKIEESEQAFLRSIADLEAAKEQTYEKNPYAKDMDIEQLRTNILTRYAYLLYLRGQPHWNRANEKLSTLSPEHLRETTTGMFYYCYIRLHTAAPAQRARVCEEIEKTYLTSFDRQKRHETAYAELLMAQITLTRANRLNWRKSVKTCRNYAMRAVEDARTAGRMDQLPLVLNEILDLHLTVLERERAQDRKATALHFVRGLLRELEETYSLHEIPIYKLDYLFLKARYCVCMEDTDGARRLYETLCQSPVFVRYFGEKLRDLRRLLKE